MSSASQSDAEYQQSLGLEIEVLSHISDSVSLRIPHYEFIARDKSFAGYRIIGGQQLLKPAYDALATQDKTEIASQLADFMIAIHQLDTSRAPLSLCKPSYMAGDQADAKDLTKKHLGTVLSEEDFTIVQTILDEMDELLAQPTPEVFIHGDIYHSHLFWDGAERKLGLIDFSDMCLADPAIDFAELFEYGDDFVEQVYQRYTGTHKSPDFLERAWKYQRWIGVYMMIDHFMNHKTPFNIARETFDRVK